MPSISRNFKIAIVLIVLLVSLTYSITLDYPFLYDDDPVILSNYTIRSFDIGRIIEENLPRPLLALTFAFNYKISKLDPSSYRTFNIVVHIINSILVYLFCILFFTNFLSKESFVSCYSEIISFISSLVFACHPTAVESVTYISSRSSILSAFFYLFALICFIKYLIEKGRNRIIYSLLVFVSFLLGLLVKENLLALPLLCFLIEYLFVYREKGKREKKNGAPKISFLIYALWGFLIVAYFISRIVLVKDIEYGLKIRSFYTQFLSQMKVFFFYLKLLLFPVNLNICHDIREITSLFSLQGILSLLGITALFIMVFIFFRKERFVVFFFLWFVINLLPTSVFPLDDLASERWIYLPSLGVFTLFAAFLVKGISSFFSSLRKRELFVWISTGTIIILLCLLTYNRNQVWESQYKLWSDSVKKSPNKARAHLNLGMALEAMNDYEGAMREYKKTIQLDSSYPLPYNNIGVLYCNKQQYDKAVGWFQKAVDINPEYVDAYFNLALIYKKKGMIDRAIEEYEKAEKINPNDVPIQKELGILYMKKGDLSNALKKYEKVVELTPDDWEALKEVGRVYFSLGRYDDAVKSLKRAININPKADDAWLYLAMTYTTMKRYDEAIEIYRMIIQKHPDYVEAHYSIAVNYLEKGDLEDAEKELSNLLSKKNDKRYHNLLGALYIKKNDLDKATLHFKEALKIDPYYETARKNLNIVSKMLSSKKK
ncbi:MAG: tetratricopeptide repeat protein [Candidatus Schekmanbacteria bacterium]|nr:MAG: tetratricopeptide repeat protein [Candidatus Schekmanbacteria bacterium]